MIYRLRFLGKFLRRKRRCFKKIISQIRCFIFYKFYKYKNTRPKVSIIIPFYNSAATMERCLRCVVNSVGVPHEIICVDDGSTDKSPLIVKRFQKSCFYDNFRLIRLGENKGLFHARMAGIQAAQGEYIGFLDSDDLVSDDYFDNLYSTASRERADIAVGRVVNQTFDGKRYIQTRCAVFPYPPDEDYNYKNAAELNLESLFWNQEGRCYHFHVVWNKLYKADILRDCLKILSGFQVGHLVMMEDFLYSLVWFSRIQTFALARPADYYYIENPASSIRAKTGERVKKNLLDIQKAFQCAEDYLIKSGKTEKYGRNLREWKNLYGRIWRRNLAGLPPEDFKSCQSVFLDIFESDGDIGEDRDADEYYYKKAEWIGEANI